MFKKVSFLLLFVMLASTFLAACGPPETIIEKVPETVERIVDRTVEVLVPGETVKIVEQTVEVGVPQTVVVAPPTEPPVVVDRQGAWVDTVIMIEEPNTPAGVTRLASGELDIYAYTIADRELFRAVRENPDLSYAMSYGSYNELSFNPAGPIFEGTGELNPFAEAKMREAMNWLIDRDYIVQEIFGGLAVARYTCFNTSVPDYAKNADLLRAIELRYAYDPAKAKAAIDEAMGELGATLVDGKWNYNGKPVTIIFLIRPEDDRLAIGDYVSNQLESVGFTVDRQYKRAADASPIWYSGDPNMGEWHVYTGGWISTAISRDMGGNFAFFYTDMGLAAGLWQNYKNDPAFYEVAERLDINDFKSLEERSELIRTALDLSMQDSYRVWINDRVSFAPYRANIQVSSDLSGSVYGSALWAQTLRRVGEIGGSVTIAMPSILTEPWNPIAGSNWIYDRFIQRGSGSMGTAPDPYTGLQLPLRVERAEVVVQEGLPVGTSLDWVDLSFAPMIEVPANAWVDWDAVNQKFITAGEKFTQTQEAMAKVTYYYPADLYQTVKWHDGSVFSAADIVLRMIIAFDRGNPDSAIYDAAAAPALRSFMAAFKGINIISTNPLVFEYYTNNWTMDAENIGGTWWPEYGFGEAPWHALVPALRAEAAGEVVFSQAKATALEVERISFLSGPTLANMNKYLVSSTAELYIPYAPTLGEFVTSAEATVRYVNLAEWIRTKGHFWVGTGPFYIERAFPLEGTVLMRRFAAYPDMADRWDRFAEARIAVVDVYGVDTVTIGKEATFDIELTFKDEPYPMADVEQVKFLLLDARGEIAYVGEAEAVADGLWVATIPADVSAKLTAGANRLEVAAVLRVVALPAFGSIEFDTIP